MQQYLFSPTVQKGTKNVLFVYKPIARRLHWNIYDQAKLKYSKINKK